MVIISMNSERNWSDSGRGVGCPGGGYMIIHGLEIFDKFHDHFNRCGWNAGSLNVYY